MIVKLIDKRTNTAAYDAKQEVGGLSQTIIDNIGKTKLVSYIKWAARQYNCEPKDDIVMESIKICYKIPDLNKET